MIGYGLLQFLKANRSDPTFRTRIEPIFAHNQTSSAPIHYKGRWPENVTFQGYGKRLKSPQPRNFGRLRSFWAYGPRGWRVPLPFAAIGVASGCQSAE